MCYTELSKVFLVFQAVDSLSACSPSTSDSFCQWQTLIIQNKYQFIYVEPSNNLIFPLPSIMNKCTRWSMIIRQQGNVTSHRHCCRSQRQCPQSAESFSWSAGRTAFHNQVNPLHKHGSTTNYHLQGDIPEFEPWQQWW